MQKSHLLFARFFLAVLGLCAATLHAQAPEGPMTPTPGVVIQQAPPQPKFKVQTILVSVPVTVRNLNGEMVHSLESRNFRVTDNGAEQRITHFELGGEPISLVVVVETSSRISPLLPQIRKMGILVSQQVTGPTGETAIVGFDDTVQTLLDFTNNADDVERTMNRLQEGYSGSKLFDAMSKGVELLMNRAAPKAGEPLRRRVMLVLSEAHDAGSEMKLGEVLRRAQLANVTIYTVGLSSKRADLQRKADYHPLPSATPEGTFGMPGPPGTVQTPTTEMQSREGVDLLALAVWAVQHAKDQVTSHELEIAAVATGGVHVSTWKDRTIEKVIDEIGGELHSQYFLTYAPSDADTSGYHEIKVDVDRPELKVRARPGYYLGSPES
jgi:VWFA-related protein